MKVLMVAGLMWFMSVPLAAQDDPKSAAAVLKAAGIDESCVYEGKASLIGSTTIRMQMMMGITGTDSLAANWLATMKNEKIPPAQIRAAFCGEVTPRMPRALVEFAWGEPDRTTTTATELGTAEQMWYGTNRLVVVVNDTVRSVTIDK